MVMSPADVSSRTDIFSVVVAKRAPKVEARVTRCDLSAAPVGMLGPSTAAASFLPNSVQTIFHQPGSLRIVITAILNTITSRDALPKHALERALALISLIRLVVNSCLVKSMSTTWKMIGSSIRSLYISLPMFKEGFKIGVTHASQAQLNMSGPAQALLSAVCSCRVPEKLQIGPDL
jgi:hypothetical protein